MPYVPFKIFIKIVIKVLSGSTLQPCACFISIGARLTTFFIKKFLKKCVYFYTRHIFYVKSDNVSHVILFYFLNIYHKDNFEF